MDYLIKKQASQNGPGGEALSTESLQAMSPVELADALERALDAMTEEDYDLERIEAYLNALDAKAPMPEQPDPEKAFREFQGRLQTVSSLGGTGAIDKKAPVSAGKRRPFKRMAVTVAATVALLFTLMVGAQAAGMNIFGNLAQWTDEVFSFLPSSEENARNAEYHAAFQQALEAQGMPKELAPAWYPKGFSAKEPETWDNEMGKFVELHFKNDVGEAFYIGVDQCSEVADLMPASYEKDSGTVEIYTSGERTFYIMSNINSLTATWSEGNMAETIRGQISVEEAKKMIDSMGG